MTLFQHGKYTGLAFTDITTGTFYTKQFPTDQIPIIISSLLHQFQPSECVLHENHYANSELLSLITNQIATNIYPFALYPASIESAEQEIKNHFGEAHVHSFYMEQSTIAMVASAGLIAYLKHTQQQHVSHIQTIDFWNQANQMTLDRSTTVNLELFQTIYGAETQGSLIHIIDHTVTAMGGRLLRDWVKQPLTNYQFITDRHNAIEELLQQTQQTERITFHLKRIIDIERLIARLSVGLANARDLINLKLSLQHAAKIKTLLSARSSTLLSTTEQSLHILNHIITHIEKTILEEPNFDIKEGNLIKPGVNNKLDQLKTIVSDNKRWIKHLEEQERKKTGIPTLKIRFNKVFGFYIEISNAHKDKIPSSYMRKQTLVNGERFITQELKQKEEQVLVAEEEMKQLEYSLFLETVTYVLEHISSIQQTAKAIATTDCLVGLANVAKTYNYTKPIVQSDDTLTISDGRHPIVEQQGEKGKFVPNSISMSSKNGQIGLLTGPNMAGKSVFIRQVATICLLNQIGSYVPAKQAKLPILDAILVRAGASDIISAGLSTFMVEMVETATILEKATPNSLIVLDEVGRGTSTYDGISIAWAIVEELVKNPKKQAKTLFATHYHELHELGSLFPNQIKNYHMAIDNSENRPVFLHTLVEGPASQSYGIEVAQLAGLPEPVITRAQQLLTIFSYQTQPSSNQSLAKTHNTQKPKDTLLQNGSLKKYKKMVDKLNKVDINSLTPLDALNQLSDLKQHL